MNKHLISVAMAASLTLPGLVSADMKITGQLQIEVVNTSTGGNTNPATEGLSMDDGSEAGVVGAGSASALGIVGNHDLGNGLTGFYKLNFQVIADDGSGISDRDQYIGASGDFGSVLLGRMNSPYKTTTASWDPLYATFLQARGSNGMSTLHDGYIDNTIAYRNKFGEISFIGALALDETDSDGDNDADGDHTISLGINMPVADAMELALAFHDNGPAEDGDALKAALKWTIDEKMTAVFQFETLGAGAGAGQGESNNLYANLRIALQQGAAVVFALASQSDESAAGDNDGTYVAAAYQREMNKYLSYHAGLVIIDEGQTGDNNDATQIGAGVRLNF